MRKNFGFSSHEIRGMYVLIFLMIVAFSFPAFLKRYLKSIGDDDVEQEQALLDQWIAESKLKIAANSDKKKELTLIMDHFDPNVITTVEWETRGFSNKISERIRKYIDKGGRFYKSEDLLKVYGIDQRLAKAYFEYMYFAPPRPKANYTKTRVSKKKETIPYKAKEFVKFDLNEADTTQLKTIKGIGSYYAKSIVDYREKLGGLVNTDQLLEIYGVKQEVKQLLIDHTTLAPSVPQQININSADFDELFGHPYIDYGLTVAILKYKKQHGPYLSIEALQDIVVLKDSIFQKVKPYVTIED
ncbi:MAG: helix-hairpin-helix domain-containing protein [Reichenbachiella sp.]